MNNVIDVEAIRSKVKDYVAANSILEVGTKLTDDTDSSYKVTSILTAS